MMSHVKAIAFLSTPHRGGNGAERLSQILQIFNMSKDYIKELASNSAFLQNINDDFTNMCQDLRLFSFYETLKTFSGTGNSYVRSLQRVKHIPLLINHRNFRSSIRTQAYSASRMRPATPWWRITTLFANSQTARTLDTETFVMF